MPAAWAAGIGAVGGIASALISKSSKPKPTTSTTKTSIPSNYQALMDRSIELDNQAFDTPFQAYGGQRISDLSANEQAGTAMAGANAGMYQPLINMSMMNNASMQANGGLPNQNDINGLINPYVNYVLGNSLDRLQEQSDTNMTKIGSMAGMSGAFGGTRQGVLEGANLAELLKSTRDLSGSTYKDAYDTGMNNWFRGQDNNRQNISQGLNIAQAGSNYNTQDINNLMSTGKTGRAVNQANADFDFSEFMREQQDPLSRANSASALLANYPKDLFTTTTTGTGGPQAPKPNYLGSAIGGAAVGIGLYDQLGSNSGQNALNSSSSIPGLSVPGGGNSTWDLPSGKFGAIPGFGGSAAGGLIKLAKGGKVKHFAKGDPVTNDEQPEGKDPIAALIRWKDEMAAMKARGEKIPLSMRMKFHRQSNNVIYHGTDLSPDEENASYIEWSKNKPEWKRDDLESQVYRDMMHGSNKVPWNKGIYVGPALDRYRDLQRAHAVLYPDKLDVTDGPWGDEIVTGAESKAQYAKGGRVKKFADGATTQQQQDPISAWFAHMQANKNGVEPNSILYGAQAGSPTTNGTTGLPPMDWDAFMQRHQMGQYKRPDPTVQNIPLPNAQFPHLPGQHPDLSMFMQQLQQRTQGATMGQQGQGAVPLRQGLPGPQGFAKGGKVESDPIGNLISNVSGDDPIARLIHSLNTTPLPRAKPTDTVLTPKEEDKFQTWKSKYAPKDSGEDYDLRGAYKAGLKPDPQTGHWPDTFKKPNHPTFSNESKYYNLAPDRAGTWSGNTFIPPSQTQRPRGFAKGGRVSDETAGQVRKFAGGKKVPHDGSLEDITSLLGNYKVDNKSRAPMGDLVNFTQPDDPMGGYSGNENNMPIDYRMDPERIYDLFAQKHESGAKYYDQPDWQARPWVDKKDHSKGALSSAFGIGQWLSKDQTRKDGTKQLSSWNQIRALAKKDGVELSPADPDAGKIPSLAEQQVGWKYWKQIQQKELGDSYNDPVVRMAHHQLGIKDLSKVRNSDKNAPMAKAVGPKIAHNVSADDETVGDYLTRLHGEYTMAGQWEREQLSQNGGNLAPLVGPASDESPLSAVAAELGTPGFFPTSNRLKTPETYVAAHKLFDLAGLTDAPTTRKVDQDTPHYVINALSGRPIGNIMSDNQVDPKHRISADGGAPLMDRTDTPPMPRKNPLRYLDEYLSQQTVNKATGGYVKKFAGGGHTGPKKKEWPFGWGTTQTDPYQEHSLEENPTFIFNEGKDSFPEWFQKRLKTMAVGRPFKNNTIDAFSPPSGMQFGGAGDPNVQEMGPPGSQWDNPLNAIGLSMENYPVDNSSANVMGNESVVDTSYAPSSVDALTNAAAKGDGSGGLDQPVAEHIQTQREKTQSMIDDLIQKRIQQITDGMASEENDNDPLKGIFGNYNKGLFQMGMGILAQATPGTGIDAVAKGVLISQQSEEQAQIAKTDRQNNRLKELINAKYMQSMISSMDPETRMNLAKENNKADMSQKMVQDINQANRDISKSERDLFIKTVANIQAQHSMGTPLSEEEQAYVNSTWGRDAEGNKVSIPIGAATPGIQDDYE